MSCWRPFEYLFCLRWRASVVTDCLSTRTQMRRCEPGLDGIRHCLLLSTMTLAALMTTLSHPMKAFLLMSLRVILAILLESATLDQSWSGLIWRMSRLIVC